MFVDGAPEAVNGFLAEIRNHMRGYIDSEDSIDRDGDPKMEGFRIWY
jgi:hypothetical protein